MEFTGTLRNCKIVSCFIQLTLQIRRKTKLLLFGLPTRCQRIGLLFKARQVFFQLFKPVLGSRIGFLFQGFALDLHLNDASIEFIQLLRLGVNLHAHTRCSFIHKVNCLVRQKAVGDITVRQHGGGNKSRVGDTNLVMLFVFLLQSTQNGNRVFHCRFRNHDRLETASQRCILFYMLAIFIQSRCADAVKLTTSKSRLEKVRRIHGAVGLSSPHQSMHLVNEEDDIAVFRLNLVQYGFQAFLKFTAIFCAGDQRAHIKRHQLLVAQRFRHVAIDDT